MVTKATDLTTLSLNLGEAEQEEYLKCEVLLHDSEPHTDPDASRSVSCMSAELSSVHVHG